MDLDGAGGGVRCGWTSGPASPDCLPGRIEAVILALGACGEQRTVRGAFRHSVAKCLCSAEFWDQFFRAPRESGGDQ